MPSSEIVSAKRLSPETLEVQYVDGRVNHVPVSEANAAYQRLLAEGVVVPAFTKWPDLPTAKRELLARVEASAAALRVAVSGTSDANKMAVYNEKYIVAGRAIGGDAAALAILAPEAIERGATPDALARLVRSLGDAWRAAGLRIDAVGGGHKFRIEALTSLQDALAYDPETGWDSIR